MLFNNNASMTYKQIMDELLLTDELLRDALMKLCNPRSQILLKKNSKVPRFAPDEPIMVNKKF